MVYRLLQLDSWAKSQKLFISRAVQLNLLDRQDSRLALCLTSLKHNNGVLNLSITIKSAWGTVYISNVSQRDGQALQDLGCYRLKSQLLIDETKLLSLIEHPPFDSASSGRS
jgi:hypothetical protein